MRDEELLTRVREAHNFAKASLLAERGPHGHWEGELSSSALSTATAIIALQTAAPHSCSDLISGGVEWLMQHQDDGGGWGDTIKSKPNISTTLLCWAALGVAGDDKYPREVRKLETWIRNRTESLSPTAIVETLKKRYGKDQTFSVPILMACALGGKLGPAPGCWKHVPQLPFELAALPRTWFAALSLPVVSYALPALIAIGQARHHHAPGLSPMRLARAACQKKTLRLLRELQPASGGYLEAVPLTSFVTMALGSIGQAQSETAVHAVSFLRESVRTDGSWPIDSNLATWVTTLAVRALGGREFDRAAVRNWLLGQQYREIHPYTLSAPGGFAWTDLPGGVPDADDTSGAALALAFLAEAGDKSAVSAAQSCVSWLMGLQNRDGGIPTFCRGWGTLPFDRSTPEITAHAVRALEQWGLTGSYQREVARAVRYLAKSQHADGWWVPLWFGNEQTADESNRCYGTAAVVRDLATLEMDSFPEVARIRRRAAAWLVSMQHEDGSWGGGTGEEGLGSIEETAMVLQALATCGDASRNALTGGVRALLRMTNNGTDFPAAPIGLYFARLWYFEKIYPLVWTVAALRDAQRVLDGAD